MVDGGTKAARQQLAALLADLALARRRCEAGTLRRLDHRLQWEHCESEEGAHREGREQLARPVGELFVVDLELQRMNLLLELRLQQPTIEALAALDRVAADPLEPLVIRCTHVVVHTAARGTAVQ